MIHGNLGLIVLQLYRLGGRSPFSDFASSFGDFADTADGFEDTKQHVMSISFEEAARGAQKTVNLNVVDDCPACFGKGVQPGYKKVSVFIHFYICANGKALWTLRATSFVYVFAFLFSSTVASCMPGTDRSVVPRVSARSLLS